MKKCNKCGHILFSFRNHHNVQICDKCFESIRLDVANRKSSISKLLYAIKNTASVDAKLDYINEALLNVSKLIRYENAGLVGGSNIGKSLNLKIKSIRTEVLHPEPEAAPQVEKFPIFDNKDDSTEEEFELVRTNLADMLYLESGGIKERRGWDRKKIEIYSMIFPGNLRAVVKDISLSGLFASCQTSRPIGQEVRLTLITSHGPLLTRGTVRRAIGFLEDQHSGDRTGLGISFEDASEDLKNFLESFYDIGEIEGMNSGGLPSWVETYASA